VKVTFSDDGWDDYLYWQTQDRKILKRINQLIEDISGMRTRGSGSLSRCGTSGLDGGLAGSPRSTVSSTG
jgi:hypothetical protein